jgi:hypothetical protein
MLARRTDLQLRLACLSLCIAGLAGCSKPATAIPSFNSTQDLTNALRSAGHEVSETAILGPHFFAPGQVVQVDSALVYIYHFDDPAELQSHWGALVATQVRPAPDEALPPEDVLAWSSGRLIVVVPGPSAGVTQALEPLLGPPIAAEAPVLGEPFPPGVSAAIGEAATALGVDPGDLAVREYESKTWPDSCLGYPQPGERCAPPAVSGWQVLLRHDSREIEVHTDSLGNRARLAQTP